VGQARFPEVHLIVNHPGQQVATFGFDDLISIGRGNIRGNLLKPPMTNQHVAFPGAAFVDQQRILNQ
jgi:hypothetical protein